MPLLDQLIGAEEVSSGYTSSACCKCVFFFKRAQRAHACSSRLPTARASSQHLHGLAHRRPPQPYAPSVAPSLAYAWRQVSVESQLLHLLLPAVFDLAGAARAAGRSAGCVVSAQAA